MSPMTKEELRQQRKRYSEWRKAAIVDIDFKTMAELARASGVNEGDLSGISQGSRKPSDVVADKLIRAIQVRNYVKGWTYLESAYKFQATFNYLRNHYATYRGQSVVLIEDADINRWNSQHLMRLRQSQSDYDEVLNIMMLHASTNELLGSLLTFLKSWEMKHDFGYLGKVKDKFRDNFPLIIEPAIRRGMSEPGHYPIIQSIYTEIRHIAHLCRAFELVHQMSEWLSERAIERNDRQVEIQAKVTYAWMLTSKNTQMSLYEAQKLMKEISHKVKRADFLAAVSVENMDVIAILAELRLRLAIRLDKQRYRPLGREEFELLLEDSKSLLTQPHSFQSLTPRLQSRYQIPLNYQHGVYSYLLGDYDVAQSLFEEIANQANYIGWIRVEQAAYSWLATLFEVTGDRAKCSATLDKIAVPYLPKRQLICQSIRARLNGG